MTMVIKIATIVLNWNNAKDTIECLHSLHTIQDPNHQIIVVDNGSTDSSLAEIRKAFPHLDYVENESNLGFAEGNNRGILYALEKGADYLLLLNNDTVVDPAILQAFRKALTLHPAAGAFGAKIYFYDEPTLIWHAGGDVSLRLGKCYHHGSRDSDLDKKWEHVREINYACGCAILVKAEAIRQVGLMDPRFFLIWEEVDWCWRMRKAGYPILFIPEAKLWHKVSASFEGGHKGPLWHYFYARNRLLFFKKNTSLKTRLTLYKRLLFKEGPFHLRQADPESKATLRGWRDFFLRSYGLGSSVKLK
jgi:GT2 family glycosyltransferase